MIYGLKKASMLKRISAFLCDLILTAILAVGFAALLSAVTGYDARVDRVASYYQEYSERYGIDLNISQTEYDQLPEEKKELYQSANEAMNRDPDVRNAYALVLTLTLLIISLGIFFAYFILEFLIPLLLFRNGQTVGKKVFGICLVRTDGVKITPLQLFVRSILGKYTLETMVPVLIAILIFFGRMGLTGAIVILGLLILEIVMVIATPTNSFLHDLVAGTAAADQATQMIFDSAEDLIAYKKRVAAEAAEKKPY